MSLEVVILAAGKGSRMNSDLPKVLQCVGGRPLLEFVFLTALGLEASRIHLVTGGDNAAISNHIEKLVANKDIDGAIVNWVNQDEQLGTGHAVLQATPHIDESAVVLVLYADVPLVSAATLSRLVELAGTNQVALLTSVVEDATGYGRILRDANKQVIAIVEEQDCSEEQRKLREINSGIIAAPGGRLKKWLSEIDNRNAQAEYYLTDVIALAHADGVSIQTVGPDSEEEFLGVNNLTDLARIERVHQLRRANELMHAGVTVMDPARLDIRGEVEVGPGSVIDINVVIEGPSTLGEAVYVGANTTVRGSMIGDRTRIRENCVIDEARVGADGIVGPFARLRPGTRLGDAVHIGNFVEVKNSRLEDGVKANHMSYIGDATIGEWSNISAGVITCNYDGADKHRTEIGRNVFVGSDVQLVAPVSVGDDASIGAGSTITSDVPKKSLAVSRGRQRNISGWSRPAKKQTR